MPDHIVPGLPELREESLFELAGPRARISFDPGNDQRKIRCAKW